MIDVGLDADDVDDVEDDEDDDVLLKSISTILCGCCCG